MHRFQAVLASLIALLWQKLCNSAEISLFGKLELDEISWFEIDTAVGQTTLVSLEAEDCGGLTTLLTSYGMLPYPSTYDILIPLNDAGEGKCSVAAVSTPFVRQV